MGGLQLVMPQAFAETDCGALADTGRNVVEFNLTGESVTTYQLWVVSNIQRHDL